MFFVLLRLILASSPPTRTFVSSWRFQALLHAADCSTSSFVIHPHCEASHASSLLRSSMRFLTNATNLTCLPLLSNSSVVCTSFQYSSRSGHVRCILGLCLSGCHTEQQQQFGCVVLPFLLDVQRSRYPCIHHVQPWLLGPSRCSIPCHRFCKIV